MKLLFDENLSRQLVRKLEDLFAASTHVAFVNLLSSPDTAAWQFAKDQDFAIVPQMPILTKWPWPSAHRPK